MFESFGRGFRMIWASIKMGLQDSRLMLPSIITVFTNFLFAAILYVQAKQRMGPAAGGMARQAGDMLRHGDPSQLVSMTGLNGPMDPSGFSFGSLLTNDTMLLGGSIIVVWWITNRFLEGVTTALVYSHLTEGAGSGKFSIACQAVFSSLPAICMLGLATFIAKKLAGWMRDKRGSGVLGFGVNFLAQVVEVFWTLAGHLILPAIVIEGTSFWGAMKRADRIAQGNLLTIGVGEVGVDAICRAFSGVVYLIGLGGFCAIMYAQNQHMPLPWPLITAAGTLWIALVVGVTAASLYIRAAFYTCLYVWAIESEAVEEAERHQITAPAPLAAALA
jgi:hypothetical protein